MFGKKSKEMSLEKVSELLSGVATPLSLYLVPTNLDSERKKFFGSSTYNPMFKYRRPKAVTKNNSIFEKLSNLETVKDVDPEISKFIISIPGFSLASNIACLSDPVPLSFVLLTNIEMDDSNAGAPKLSITPFSVKS